MKSSKASVKTHRPVVGQHQHIGAAGQREFEDRVFSGAIKNGALTLAIVADGIGGGKLGERAATETIETIKSFCESSTGTNIPEMLKAAIEQANRQVYDEGQHELQKRRMGSTVAVAAIYQNKLYVANAGDSRVYLIQGNKVKQLTVDHTWAYAVIKEGKASKERAYNHPRAGELTRSVGYAPNIRVDLGLYLRGGEESDDEARSNQGLPLKPGDFILVCSDGLIKSRLDGQGHFVEEKEFPGVLEGNTPQQAAKTLVGLAVGRNVDDNVSAVVIEIPSSAYHQAIRGVRRSPLALVGSAVSFTLCLSVFVGAIIFRNVLLNATTPTEPPPTNIPPSAAYVAAISGINEQPSGRATYQTKDMSRPEDLAGLIQAHNPFVTAGDKSIVSTDESTSVKLFLTQSIIVWLGPGTDLEIRTIASPATNVTSTEINLINGAMLTVVTSRLPAGNTYRVIGDPRHVAQVVGSVMGVRYDRNTFEADCLEGQCISDGQSLSTCQMTYSGSDLIPQPPQFANQSWYSFIGDELTKGLKVKCIPTATPTKTNTPTPTATRKPTPIVLTPAVIPSIVPYGGGFVSPDRFVESSAERGRSSDRLLWPISIAGYLLVLGLWLFSRSRLSDIRIPIPSRLEVHVSILHILGIWLALLSLTVFLPK